MILTSYVISIDGLYIKSFDGPPKGQSGASQGWYTEVSSALGTIEYTEDINEAYEVAGRINLKSTFDRIISRMSEQGLRFTTLKFVEKTRD